MFLLLLIIVLVLAHLAAKNQADTLKRNPDPYPIARMRQPMTGETVTITREDGTKINVLVAGSGPTVVLAHGYGITLKEWNIVWDKLLEQGYRLIAFDQRGHGQSTIGSDGIGSKQMASDYKAVLEHFDVRDGILVGHSMGGFLSIIFMLTYPELVTRHLKGCVLFASTAGNVVEGSPQNRVQIPLLKAGIIQRVAQTDVYGTLFASSLYGQQPAPGGMQFFLDIFVTIPHQRLIPILEALAHEDYYARLGEIQIPCVVICGELDKTTPRWHSERMGKEIPNARNVWVKGKGHVLNWEAPESLIETIQSF